MILNSKNRLIFTFALMFVTCIYTAINLLIYNFYYLPKVYENTLTADGNWFVSLKVVKGYFSDPLGIYFGSINIILILLCLLLYYSEYIYDYFQTKKDLKKAINKSILEKSNKKMSSKNFKNNKRSTKRKGKKS